MIIDVHSHIYPKVYMDYLSKKNVLTPNGIIVNNRVYVVNDLLLNLEDKIRDFKNKVKGEDVTIFLSIPPPWTYFLPKDEEVKLTKSCNDELVKIVNDKELRGLATLPLNDVDEAIGEAERAIKELNLDGFILGTGVGNKSIANDEFKPLLSKISSLNKPIFIHPGTLNLGINEGALSTIVSYPFETTFVMSELAISGSLEEYNLKIIIPHGGGFIPYQLGRIDMLYESKRSKFKPSEYLLKSVYYDTVMYDNREFELLVERVGTEKVVFGTDHPFPISKPELFIKIVGSLTKEERDKILYENAKKLFSLA
ncbi:hypothetical protein BFU36_13200 [Sulfolobus sp. A20]|uniref:amidohydrolase family protein n=1 Tax=Sulfolobaceae TaxID=118883 RepID=UPI000845D64B|nr:MULTISPECIES: amidohydrolase family protein [unclassified Sulfolobus]TRM75948.1 amidohydrolase [Sulfolobus sp. A20-N-F8]TRM79051.1 amidohydrolase [Sulfolobus sp. B5]TRM86669.1 amidohydrolase [Sulfolobus sp. E3]TRM87974.1 amidohydrolase [Sulfolobus sp. C3]TRM93749.1 amidohydrolase [Sulfolobus sp. A20-N-G8]TRM99183.1 amidohydrolase [Sulfolobus sp. E1]TRN03523.1 amidohydrolase [Sulfolobus sp. F1]